jgi:hypothetical protein
MSASLQMASSKMSSSFSELDFSQMLQDSSGASPREICLSKLDIPCARDTPTSHVVPGGGEFNQNIVYFYSSV